MNGTGAARDGQAKSIGHVSLLAPRKVTMQTDNAPQWREVEIVFAGPAAANPYTDVDAWVIFTHDSGQQLRRPVFTDGGTTYRVRFASTHSEGEWRWTVHSDQSDHDFVPASGTLIAGPPSHDHPHRSLSRGFPTACLLYTSPSPRDS